MKSLTALGVLAMPIGALGCCNTPPAPPLPPPQVMSLDDALISVATSLQEMRSRTADLPDKAGLIPADAEVIFKVGSVDKQSKKLYVELSAPSSAPIGGKVGQERLSELTGDRSNTITIRFKQFLLADEKTILATKSEDEIKRIRAILGTWILAN